MRLKLITQDILIIIGKASIKKSITGIHGNILRKVGGKVDKKDIFGHNWGINFSHMNK